MGIKGILFSPNGRIRPSEFWRGLIIVLGLGVITSVAGAYGPDILGIPVFLISLLSIYMLVCVFGKRLHDSTKTAWFVVLFAFGYFALNVIGQQVLFPFVDGFNELQAEMQDELSNGFDWAIMTAYAERMAELTFLHNMVLTVVIGLVVGWFCARLWSDPYPNKYGAPSGSYVEPEDEDDFLM